MRRALPCAVAVLLAACAATPPPAPPSGLTTLAVAPVENRTTSPLVIAGDTWVERLVGRRERTVPDAVAGALATALRERGFTIATGAVPRLAVTLRTFEPDQPHLAWVHVAYAATLTEPDGTVRWTRERRGWFVPTTGSPSLAAAYETAAREVARGIVGGWTPAP